MARARAHSPVGPTRHHSPSWCRDQVYPMGVVGANPLSSRKRRSLKPVLAPSRRAVNPPAGPGRPAGGRGVGLVPRRVPGPFPPEPVPVETRSAARQSHSAAAVHVRPCRADSSSRATSDSRSSRATEAGRPGEGHPQRVEPARREAVDCTTHGDVVAFARGQSPRARSAPAPSAVCTPDTAWYPAPDHVPADAHAPRVPGLISPSRSPTPRPTPCRSPTCRERSPSGCRSRQGGQPLPLLLAETSHGMEKASLSAEDRSVRLPRPSESP